MKPNVITAAIVGLVLGILAEFVLNLAEQIPLVGCLFGLVAILLGIVLPMFIGALAVEFAPSHDLALPLDGALAAALAEFISRLVGFCASIVFARSFFFGPRVLFPSIEPAMRAMYAGVWSIGWFAISLFVTAILGAIGVVVYAAWIKR